MGSCIEYGGDGSSSKDVVATTCCLGGTCTTAHCDTVVVRKPYSVGTVGAYCRVPSIEVFCRQAKLVFDRPAAITVYRLVKLGTV